METVKRSSAAVAALQQQVRKTRSVPQGVAERVSPQAMFARGQAAPKSIRSHAP